MQIKKKTVQQKPIKHCKAIYPPIEKTNKNKTQKQVKKKATKKLSKCWMCLWDHLMFH